VSVSRTGSQTSAQADDDRSADWRDYLRAAGPGLVTGASDDDPSGIATYAQAGAQFRFGLLWLALVTLPLMTAVQEICDRTALATGKSLGQLASDTFGRGVRILVAVLLVALVAANTLNVAADLVAIGQGMALLHAGPAALWAAIAGAAISAALILGSFERIAKIFKYLCLTLLSYVVVLGFVKVPWGDALMHLIVPHIQLTRSYIALVVAVLGTTISPYLFFWQSAHRIEELREEPEGGDRPVPLRERSERVAEHKKWTSRLDVFSGMALSQVVMFAIIVATAATLNSHGTKTVASAASAAQALQPVAGSASKLLFAFGFIGAGFLAVPVLAGSGAAGIAGLMHKPWGYSKSPRKAPTFYGIVLLGTLGGVVLSLVHVNAITFLVVVADINGIAAAPFLVIVMLLASNRAVMGKFRNGMLATTLGWFTVALMTAAAVAMLVTT
jgi:NRAMP (natural resistance-associated macrophage protein)-like metal ion transporter